METWILMFQFNFESVIIFLVLVVKMQKSLTICCCNINNLISLCQEKEKKCDSQFSVQYVLLQDISCSQASVNQPVHSCFEWIQRYGAFGTKVYELCFSEVGKSYFSWEKLVQTTIQLQTLIQHNKVCYKTNKQKIPCRWTIIIQPKLNGWKDNICQIKLKRRKCRGFLKLVGNEDAKWTEKEKKNNRTYSRQLQ